ncbi:MAG: hypothetical protein MK108_02030 [Mariniblastus sp.]|nr:hypothetical protein [Mariniblastus sp.]
MTGKPSTNPGPGTRFPCLATLLGLAMLILVGSVSQIGCHRSFYRRQADAEAQRLIREKQNDPRWSCTSDGTILINPESRMFDPFSQDHPPMPPDDPTSHKLMECVDGHPGYPLWGANGNTNYVVNPDWQSYLPANADGEVVLDLSTAYRLALINSTELQQARESLYSSALRVSLQRFNFEAQMFAGSLLDWVVKGKKTSELRTSTSTRGGTKLTKLGTAGASYAMELANRIVWNFNGSNLTTATSLIHFTFSQPLLRKAGRDYVMENLTQEERTLLANVRQFDRYRRGFYLRITTGRSPGNSLASQGIVLPQGFSTNVGGYLGLLQQQQQIRIDEFNVSQLEDVLEQFREYFKRDRISGVQVSNFESTVYNSQRRLLERKTSYQNQVDSYKILLGLPPTVNLVIKDDYLDRFKFISDGITGRQTSINDLRVFAGERLNQLDDTLPKTQDQVADFTWPDDLDQNIQALLPFIEQARETLETLRTLDSQELENDFDQLAAVREQRVIYLDNLKQAIETGAFAGEFDVRVDPAMLQSESIQSPDTLREVFAKLQVNADETETALQQLIENINAFPETRQGLTDEQLYTLVDDQIIKATSTLLSAIYDVALEMSLLQAEARSNSIGLPEVNLTSEDAIKIARCFRRDWMNARAALVDEWRGIQVTANSLESELNWHLDYDLGNSGGNQLNYSVAGSGVKTGFSFDTPIVRQQERNDYRNQLIAYQQRKRDFYKFEDEIKRNLRATLRTIDLNKILFELNRQSIKTAIQALEQARFDLVDPRQQQLGPTVQQNLTNAISGLQNAQVSFLNGWVQFEVLRRGLDLDLGTFQIGPGCDWIDPEVIDNQIGFRAAAMMGIDLENDPFCQVGELGDPPTIAPGLFEEQPPITEPAPGQEPPTSKLETVPSEEQPSGETPDTPNGEQTGSLNVGGLRIQPAAAPMTLTAIANPSEPPTARFDFTLSDRAKSGAQTFAVQTFTAGQRVESVKPNPVQPNEQVAVQETLSDSSGRESGASGPDEEPR